VISVAILAAIKARHCLAPYERFAHGTVEWHWDRAFLDTFFAPIYAQVPITVRETDGPTYDLVIRVFPYRRDMPRLCRLRGTP
jgi:hypothetical protein